MHWSRNGVLSVNVCGASMGQIENANELASAFFSFYTTHQPPTASVCYARSNINNCFCCFFACCMRECCRTHSLTQTTLASSFFCIYAISNTHKKYKWLFSFFVCAFYLVCLLVSLVCSCVLVSLTILPCLYEFLCFRHKPILIKGLDTFL